MQCILTKLHFDFKGKNKDGIHPLAFNYDLATIIRILRNVSSNPRRLTKFNQIYLRLAVLLYLSESVGLDYGSVTYKEYDNIKCSQAFCPYKFKQEIKETLALFNAPVPILKKLKIKNLPCKGTVEFLQGVFFTYQEGISYTPFRQYLETTLLSNRAIEAVVAYDLFPTEANYSLLQLVLTGQESLLEESFAECDFYNNKKIIRIKRKLEEDTITLPKPLKDILNEKYQREALCRTHQDDIPLPKVCIKIDLSKNK